MNNRVEEGLLPRVKVDEELLAEIHERAGVTDFINEINEHSDLPYWVRQELESKVRRRMYPGTKYKRLEAIQNRNVEHIELSATDPVSTGLNHYKPDDEY